ncbi:unnamed protein product [Rhizophagus irregularis]|nr:unnamed protein product [Rhizophagus irregularis]
MKSILKTLNDKYSLNYNETFNSAKNIKIRRKLIPEIRKSLAPNYRPSFNQVTRWLSSLHKSRRSKLSLRTSGKESMDNRRVHANNRLNDKKLRRIKAAKELFNKKDSRITSYGKRDLLKILANRAYHSPEVSETEDEGSKSVINVYDLSWRSEEVTYFILIIYFAINFH